MLRKRILTAIILVSLLIVALFFFPIHWNVLLFGLFVAAAAWEWAALSGFQRLSAKLLYVFSILVLGIAGISTLSHATLVIYYLFAALLWWIWAFVEIISRKEINQGMFTTTAGRAVGGFLVLLPLWVSTVYLLSADQGRPRDLLFLFVLVWVADTAAYFTGSFLGRTKLAPKVSPGKSVEGVVGGLIGAVLLAWLCGTMIWNYEFSLLMQWIGLAVVVVLFSVVGDLTESKLKRVAGVKDSGNLLPGHGGILDRIDALTAAAPVYALGLILLAKS
jgi:phosphatidate cytidylyltransferase